MVGADEVDFGEDVGDHYQGDYEILHFIHSVQETHVLRGMLGWWVDHYLDILITIEHGKYSTTL